MTAAAAGRRAGGGRGEMWGGGYGRAVSGGRAGRGGGVGRLISDCSKESSVILS